MPSFEMYRKMIGVGGATTVGQAHKRDSDLVMEATWDNDIETRTCYLYDYWHDNYKDQLRNLHPEQDKNKIPISLKYIQHSSQTYDKDTITFHVQMRPFQEMCVDYYPKFFEQRYNSIFPCGLFVDIPDNKGQYNRWLIVNTANFYDTQFSTFEVLPCDYIFNWVWKGEKIKMAGCLRSQNS